MKNNKLIIILILFLIIYLCFSSISFAANIDKLPQDFGSFDKYLKAIEDESATALDEKALDIMKQTFGDNGSNMWQSAKQDEIGRYEVDDDDDNSGDREVILSQIEQKIDSWKQSLQNSYEQNYRDYSSEYFYNFFVERKSSIENAVESSNSQDAMEAFENFLSQGAVLITQINSYLDKDLTEEELSAAVTEIQGKVSNLNSRLTTLKARNDMSEAQKERMQQRFDEVNAAYENLKNSYDTAADEASDGQVTYYKPTKENKTADSGQSLEDMMNDGDSFISSSNNTVIDQAQLQDGISTLYNIFLEVGVAIAVIIGLIIGIKFMIGSVEEKAEIKKLLWPYLIGCLVVFGAFGIWKIVIEIMQSL